MNELASAIANLLNALSFKRKILSICLLFVTIIWVDSQLGFTYHYFTDRKISEIQKYNEILKDTSIKGAERKLIETERISVISKSRAFIEPMKRGKADNSVLFHASYSWIMVLLLLLSRYLIRLGSPYISNRELNTQTTGVVVSIIIGIGLLYLGASAISRFFTGLTLYFINTLIQITLLTITFVVVNKANKR